MPALRLLLQQLHHINLEARHSLCPGASPTTYALGLWHAQVDPSD